MRRYALSSALFMFMERGEYWDVRCKRITNGKLECEPKDD